MSNKSFAQTPRPAKSNAPPANVIAAFERGGVGQDTQTHISTKEVKGVPSPEVEPTRRLSIDLPESLHRRFKTVCAKTDRKMLAEVLEFIQRRTVELEQE